MNDFGRSFADFGAINTDAMNFLQKTSQPWLEMMSRSLSRMSEGNTELTWTPKDMMRFWSPMENGNLLNINGQKVAMQKYLSTCLERQSNYSGFTKAWLDCVARTMEAVRTRTSQSADASEQLKIYRELAQEYSRTCADFVEKQLMQVWLLKDSADDKPDKSTPARSKGSSDSKAVN